MAKDQKSTSVQNRHNASRTTLFFSIATICVLFSQVFFVEASSQYNVRRVRHTLKPLDLSRAPATEELMAAGQLGGLLYPTEPLGIDEISSNQQAEFKSSKSSMQGRNDAINLSFGRAIQKWNKHEYRDAVELFRKHSEEFPESPWAAEAMLHVGCDARYNGRYSESATLFKQIIEENQSKSYEGAKILTDKARLRLGVLKVLQNNFEEAKEHFTNLKGSGSNWRYRTYASHWIQRLSRYEADKLALSNCGVQALAILLKKEGRSEEASRVMKMQPRSTKGHSIQDLREIAADYGSDLAVVLISAAELKMLPLPAIVQVSGRDQGDAGHYWVLENQNSAGLTFFDPQSDRRFQQKPDEFDREWDGVVLVFSEGRTLFGTRLPDTELGQIFGGCCGAPAGTSGLGNPCSRYSGSNNFSGDSPGWESESD